MALTSFSGITSFTGISKPLAGAEPPFVETVPVLIFHYDASFTATNNFLLFNPTFDTIGVGAWKNIAINAPPNTDLITEGITNIPHFEEGRLNLLPGVRFNILEATGPRSLMQNVNINLPQPFSIYVVFETSVLPGFQGITIGAEDTLAFGSRFIVNHQGGSLLTSFGAISLLPVEPGPAILRIFGDGVSSKVSVEYMISGNLFQNTSDLGTEPLDNIRIQSGGGIFEPYRVYEILVYDKVNTTIEDEALIALLKAKWFTQDFPLRIRDLEVWYDLADPLFVEQQLEGINKLLPKSGPSTRNLFGVLSDQLPDYVIGVQNGLNTAQFKSPLLLDDGDFLGMAHNTVFPDGGGFEFTPPYTLALNFEIGPKLTNGPFLYGNTEIGFPFVPEKATIKFFGAPGVSSPVLINVTDFEPVPGLTFNPALTEVTLPIVTQFSAQVNFQAILDTFVAANLAKGSGFPPTQSGNITFNATVGRNVYSQTGPLAWPAALNLHTDPNIAYIQFKMFLTSVGPFRFLFDHFLGQPNAIRFGLNPAGIGGGIFSLNVNSGAGPSLFASAVSFNMSTLLNKETTIEIIIDSTAGIYQAFIDGVPLFTATGIAGVRTPGNPFLGILFETAGDLYDIQIESTLPLSVFPINASHAPPPDLLTVDIFFQDVVTGMFFDLTGATSLDSFSAAQNSTDTKYILDSQYHDGISWVPSNGTIANANNSVEINNEIGTLVPSDLSNVTFDIAWPNTPIRQALQNATIEINGGPGPPDTLVLSNDGGVTELNVPFPNDERVTVIIEYNHPNTDVYVNNDPVVSGPVATSLVNTIFTPFGFGSRWNGFANISESTDFFLNEVLLIRDSSATTRSELQAYFQAKWGNP